MAQAVYPALGARLALAEQLALGELLAQVEMQEQVEIPQAHVRPDVLQTPNASEGQFASSRTDSPVRARASVQRMPASNSFVMQIRTDTVGPEPISAARRRRLATLQMELIVAIPMQMRSQDKQATFPLLALAVVATTTTVMA